MQFILSTPVFSWNIGGLHSPSWVLRRGTWVEGKGWECDALWMDWAPQIQQVLTGAHMAEITGPCPATLHSSPLAAQTGSSRSCAGSGLAPVDLFPPVSAWSSVPCPRCALLRAVLRKAALHSHPQASNQSVYQRGLVNSNHWVSTCTFPWAFLKLSAHSALPTQTSSLRDFSLFSWSQFLFLWCLFF